MGGARAATIFAAENFVKKPPQAMPLAKPITVFLFAHGYASIIANNSLKYDEDKSFPIF